MRLFGFFGSGSQRVITSSVDNYNLFTELGSPANPVNITVIINSGVIVSSTSATASFSTGALAAGSIVKLINNGQIIGKGGAGGAGGNATYPTCGNGSNGVAGGDAIDTAVSLRVDNTNGDIFGGGGGGAGTGSRCGVVINTFAAGGHSGGGGAGNSGGAGGTAGTGSGAIDNIAGFTGGAGSTTGGLGGTVGVNAHISGDGGEYGAAGGAATSVGSGSVCDGSHGTGGAAGKAIELNGNSITWLGGNNPTQVKGAVS